jgi:peroxiredoxin
MKSTTIFAFLLLIFLSAASIQASDSGDGYKIGDRVADFTIENYDGVTYTLNSNGAKATVVMFLSTTCPFVQPYTDRLKSLTNEFTDKGIVFWGINSNNTESAEEVSEHKKKKEYNFPVLKDNNNIVADQFAATRTPEIFVIDNSTMTLIYHGRIDDNKESDKVTSQDLQNALNQFLAGSEITVKETKAFGCSIKR